MSMYRDLRVSLIKAFQMTRLIPLLHTSADITNGMIRRRRSAKTLIKISARHALPTTVTFKMDLLLT